MRSLCRGGERSPGPGLFKTDTLYVCAERSLSPWRGGEVCCPRRTPLKASADYWGIAVVGAKRIRPPPLFERLMRLEPVVSEYLHQYPLY
jgi:hypothetical protein